MWNKQEMMEREKKERRFTNCMPFTELKMTQKQNKTKISSARVKSQQIMRK